MDEKRRYFRIKNKGEIQATLGDNPLEVIDISSIAVLIVKPNVPVPHTGTVQLRIHNFSMNLTYDVYKNEIEKMVLLFNKEEEIERLLVVLKKLRDEQRDAT